MRFKQPPCILNEKTGKCYTRHRWVIPETIGFYGTKVPSTRFNPRNPCQLLYSVVCERCGINHPESIIY